MGVKFQAVNTTHVIIGFAGLALAYLAYKEAKKAVSTVGNAVNPVNQENIFNKGFEAVGEAITGEKDWSFGVWLADKLNPPEKYEKEALERMGYE